MHVDDATYRWEAEEINNYEKNRYIDIRPKTGCKDADAKQTLGCKDADAKQTLDCKAADGQQALGSVAACRDVRHVYAPVCPEPFPTC